MGCGPDGLQASLATIRDGLIGPAMAELTSQDAKVRAALDAVGPADPDILHGVAESLPRGPIR
jgi:hypothetical protein